MNRNLNRTYAGRRILDIGKTGVPGSTVPGTGGSGASYLYADVVANSWQASEVRGRVLSTTLPAGTWYAWSDGRLQVLPGAADGPYSLTWERFLFGAPVAGNGTLNFTIGSAATAPTIIVQPTNQSVTTPAPATFTVTAIGTALTYQWQRNPAGAGAFANISGATANTYTTPATTVTGGTANSTDTYRCVVTGSVAPAATSSAAVLTVGQTAATTVSVTLTTDGTTPATNLTNLKWAYWDAFSPDLITVAPIAYGNNGSTNGSGVFSQSIVGTARLPGGIGYLIVTNSDGTTTQGALLKGFAAPVVVS